ncbi:C40 family peptidase [Rhizocola hellebori]|uniref:C40 family peptidase n=1 Tax=Rhizocola hellebori TaxID=1392758 RepID=UPI00194262C4|nr:C40 family peptidase [Rhizocola hellebori]
MPLLPTGRLAMPPTLPTEPISFLTAQVDAAIVETQVLAEQINELSQVHEDARLSLAWADHEWRQTDEKLQVAKQNAAQAATEAYRTAGQLPAPLQGDSILRDLQQLSPQQSAKPVGESAAFELQRATDAEAKARASLVEKTEAEKVASTELTSVITTLAQRDAALLLLQQRLETLKTEEELRIERETEKLRSDYTAGQSNQGLLAHPDARKAVLFALEQLGKPYQFAEEGPSKFDCSGLVQTSYRQTGRLLPRVSKDQFAAYKDKQVQLDALLPGDLLFYARDPKDPRTIHHVMIYLGDNKVVHAPKAGDFVKISRVNLGTGSQVDFAVRVYDAVPVPVPVEVPPTTPPVTTTTSTS